MRAGASPARTPLLQRRKHTAAGFECLLSGWEAGGKLAGAGEHAPALALQRIAGDLAARQRLHANNLLLHGVPILQAGLNKVWLERPAQIASVSSAR